MLAIIIPAYKKEFLEKALESIAIQTEKRYRVYVGDDNSPHDLKSIVDRFSASIDVYYHRYPTNLGRTDLVAHWDRCIKLSTNEPWLWLFSDDDVMSDNCVAQFYKTLEATREKYDLYKFNSAVINESGAVIEEAKPLPEVLTGFQLVTQKISGKIKTYITDYIFSRRIFNETDGFVNFPLAWGADDATWVKFSGKNGIAIVPGCMVFWRLSGINISNPSYADVTRKTVGLLRYCEWISIKFERENNFLVFKRQLMVFFFDQLKQYGVPGKPLLILKICGRVMRVWNVGFKTFLMQLYR